jgi:hypothetical protein
MTDPNVLEIEGFDELIKALETSPETVIPLLLDAMNKSVRAIQARVDEYPPSTEANQPGRISIKTHKPMGYYERGRGWWYPLMRPWTAEGQKFGKALGVLKAQAVIHKATQVQGYRLAGGGTSEMLGKSWAVNVGADKTGVFGEVGNNASYTPWVQGDKQAGYHAARGWITLDTAVQQSEKDIDGFFWDALDAWQKSAGLGA